MSEQSAGAPPAPLSPQSSVLGPVLVLGHRNPDTDSICSAIAYAALRRATDLPGAVPGRLGPLWAETAFALDYFGVEPPALVEDVRRRVADVMNHDVLTVGADHTLYEAARLMREGKKGLLPVVDARDRLRGAITIDDIAARYLDDMAVVPETHAPVALDRFLRILGGELLAGAPGRAFTGRVWISSSRAETLARRLAPGDLVIVGDREDAQIAALDGGVACLIVVGDQPPSSAVRARAEALGATLISSPRDTYATARLLNLSLPVTEVMRRPGRTVDPDDLVADVAPLLLDAPGRALAVVDDDGRVRGTISRSDLLRGGRKRVILVDHNQRTQAVEGLDEAELVAVLDHHNLGDLRTAEPIPVILEPVGCTATIIAELYARAGLTPPRSLAGLLLAAIISDTLLLTSPTTTARDRGAVDTLSPLAGVDPAAFAQDLFRARSDFSATTPRELILGNLKEYAFGGATLAIGQAETLATDYFRDREETFIAELARLKSEGTYDYAIFLVTDILNGQSRALYPSDAERRLLTVAFAPAARDAGQSAVDLPGIVSRKKQVIPPLARALDRH